MSYQQSARSSSLLDSDSRLAFHYCAATNAEKISLYYLQAFSSEINPLNPNDPYRGRTAPLASKRFILYIYSTNIGTEYFKHGIYSPFFSSSKCSLFHNSNYLVPVLFTFYIQGVLKTKSSAKRLITDCEVACSSFWKDGLDFEFRFRVTVNILGLSSYIQSLLCMARSCRRL